MNIQETKTFVIGKTKRFLLVLALAFSSSLMAQTNVYDDVIATSPNHTYLKAAIDQQGLQSALRNPSATLTVFAPTNDAFDDLAAALNTNIAGILALTNLTDVLTYHVLGITVPSDSIRNGQIVTPLNSANTLKLTKTALGSVFVNQALVSTANLNTDNGVVHVLDAALLPNKTVVDIALGDQTNFSVLTAAVVKAELLPALSNPFAKLTVFAPTNTAFTNALTALGISANDLLNSPDLAKILTYHVLGSAVLSDSIKNGQIVTPLNNANTLKLTKTSTGSVYVNQAMVTTANVSADNGLVHVLNAVVLPGKTVVDIALGDQTNFSVLTAAVVKAELLPALTNPFAKLTVFAPTNTAFTNALTALDLTAEELLSSPDLADILTYHVLGAAVLSDSIKNGQIVTPLNNANTLKLTKTGTGSVYVNQAMVTTANVSADNGLVHVLNAVVLPVETVVDVALGDQASFSTLTAAVVKAELLPALSDPFSLFTVFAPTNTAFNNLATALNTNLNGILALPNLKDILLYHVLGDEVLSTELTAGKVATLSGQNIRISLMPVRVNDADVTTADVASDNGVVHVINKVLVYNTAGVASLEARNLTVFPNPANASLTLAGMNNESFEVVNIYGAVVLSGSLVNGTLAVDQLSNGNYVIRIAGSDAVYTAPFAKL